MAFCRFSGAGGAQANDSGEAVAGELVADEQIHLVLRNVVGRDIMPEDLDTTLGLVMEEMSENAEQYAGIIREIREKYLYNFTNSGAVGAAYVIEQLKALDEKRKETSN